MKENEQLSNHHRVEIMNMVREEYHALRSEISEHLKATYLIGTAVVTLLAGGLTAGGITWHDDALISTMIFSVAVPTLLFTAAIGTLYAFQQMESIGKYIKSEVEDKITFLFDYEFQEWLKEKCPQTGSLQSWRIMDWEGYVEKIRRISKLGRGYDTTVFSLVFVPPLFVSVVLGEIRVLFIADGWLSTPLWMRWFLVVIPAVIIIFGVWGCRRVRRFGASE